MAQQLRALGIFSENLSSIPSTHMAAHNCLTPIPRDLAPHTGMHAGKTSMHMKFKKKLNSLKNILPLSSDWFIYILCTLVFYLHVYLDEVRSPGTGVSNSCELPCGCWELNPDTLEEPPVLLTAEPSLQPQSQVFLNFVRYQSIGQLSRFGKLGWTLKMKPWTWILAGWLQEIWNKESCRDLIYTTKDRWLFREPSTLFIAHKTFRKCL